MGFTFLILTEANYAVRFAPEKHSAIEFRVYSCALTSYGADPNYYWELDHCQDSWPLDKSAEARWELDGRIKWDGCLDFQTNPECQFHGCGPSTVDTLRDIFAVIFNYAKRHFDLLGDPVPDLPEYELVEVSL